MGIFDKIKDEISNVAEENEKKLLTSLKNAGIDTSQISLKLLNGKATVEGSVKDSSDKNKIAEILKNSPNVNSVDNKITVADSFVDKNEMNKTDNNRQVDNKRSVEEGWISTGSKGNAVVKWQKFLLERGFKIGSADGVFGQMTHNATAKFQSENAIQSDGIVGPATRKIAAKYGYIE